MYITKLQLMPTLVRNLNPLKQSYCEYIDVEGAVPVLGKRFWEGGVWIMAERAKGLHWEHTGKEAITVYVIYQAMTAFATKTGTVKFMEFSSAINARNNNFKQCQEIQFWHE